MHLKATKILRILLKKLCESHPWKLYLKYNSRFLQQVSSHVGSDDLKGGVEIDLDVFPESRRVIVSSRFRISDGLHDWG